MSEALLVLGDHLFPAEHLAAFHSMPVFMAEDTELCARYRFHKHKIIYFLSAMRSYASELRLQNVHVAYHSLTKEVASQSYEEKLLRFCREQQVEVLHAFEIEDHFFDHRIR